MVTVEPQLARTSTGMSPVGFGAWSIGGAGWSYDGTEERDAESVATMLHAFELGVSWIDTAPNYGQGHSEKLVGRALRQVRGSRPQVFTKCGRRWDSAESPPRSDHRPASIREDCEASLRRLGVDAVDLLQRETGERVVFVHDEHQARRRALGIVVGAAGKPDLERRIAKLRLEGLEAIAPLAVAHQADVG